MPLAQILMRLERDALVATHSAATAATLAAASGSATPAPFIPLPRVDSARLLIFEAVELFLQGAQCSI